MILHDIAISGFRCFASELRVGLFNKRITVVHAPNGTGKTTLLDALYHGLLERHEVSGEKAEVRIASAGRSLQAAVDVTFQSGETRYRICKRFLKNASVKLDREENGTFVPFKDGREAEEFVRHLLFASAGLKGAMDPNKHFGIGTVLWAPQGKTAYAALPPDLAAHVNHQLK
jgi:recombinational DNA repair ATPase RecF